MMDKIKVDDPNPWKVLHFLYARGVAKSPEPVITTADRTVSKALMKMWTQFARTGNPNVKGLVDWPTYDAGSDRYLYIADPLQIKSGLSNVGKK